MCSLEEEPSRQVEEGVVKFGTIPGQVQGAMQLFEGGRGGEAGVGGV